MHTITITLAKESDKDNLLEILKSWEQGGVGIGDERYLYAGGDMGATQVYENVEEPSDFSVIYFQEASNEPA